MVSVGVKDLKNQLSRYLQLVKKGEKVIVTEHHRVIAEIREPPKQTDDSIALRELQKLSDEGRLILAKRNTSIISPPKITEKIDWWQDYEAAREDRF